MTALIIIGVIVLGLVAWFFFGRVQQRLWWLLLVPIAGVGAVMAVGGAVALGLAWYARHRLRH